MAGLVVMEMCWGPSPLMSFVFVLAVAQVTLCIWAWYHSGKRNEMQCDTCGSYGRCNEVELGPMTHGYRRKCRKGE